jgi:hypothetical protein
VLCFTNADFKALHRPFRLGSVWVTRGQRVAALVREEGSLSPTALSTIAAAIDRAFPLAI